MSGESAAPRPDSRTLPAAKRSRVLAGLDAAAKSALRYLGPE